MYCTMISCMQNIIKQGVVLLAWRQSTKQSFLCHTSSLPRHLDVITRPPAEITVAHVQIAEKPHPQATPRDVIASSPPRGLPSSILSRFMPQSDTIQFHSLSYLSPLALPPPLPLSTYHSTHPLFTTPPLPSRTA
jgi:hypothetical protein